MRKNRVSETSKINEKFIRMQKCCFFDHLSIWSECRTFLLLYKGKSWPIDVNQRKP